MSFTKGSTFMVSLDCPHSCKLCSTQLTPLTSQIPFLKFPPEIRNMIYRIVLVDLPTNHDIYQVFSHECQTTSCDFVSHRNRITEPKRTFVPPPLAQVNSQIRAEALPIFYAENAFVFTLPGGLRLPPRLLQRQFSHFLNEVRFFATAQTGPGGPSSWLHLVRRFSFVHVEEAAKILRMGGPLKLECKWVQRWTFAVGFDLVAQKAGNVLGTRVVGDDVNWTEWMAAKNTLREQRKDWRRWEFAAGNLNVVVQRLPEVFNELARVGAEGAEWRKFACTRRRSVRAPWIGFNLRSM